MSLASHWFRVWACSPLIGTPASVTPAVRPQVLSAYNTGGFERLYGHHSAGKALLVQGALYPHSNIAPDRVVAGILQLLTLTISPWPFRRLCTNRLFDCPTVLAGGSRQACVPVDGPSAAAASLRHPEAHRVTCRCSIGLPGCQLCIPLTTNVLGAEGLQLTGERVEHYSCSLSTSCCGDCRAVGCSGGQLYPELLPELSAMRSLITRIMLAIQDLFDCLCCRCTQGRVWHWWGRQVVANPQSSR